MRLRYLKIRNKIVTTVTCGDLGLSLVNWQQEWRGDKLRQLKHANCNG